ncbi:cyanase [Bacillus shivajii]|uniref:cyanase n=1 Tax=Bacillus shivajii TaxID=1983719 RepID=UPI001CFB1691|nr:cyanase [Bacillus shivajii]UCZ54137.1 cyanase [Bacillus shivajii]
MMKNVRQNHHQAFGAPVHVQEEFPYVNREVVLQMLLIAKRLKQLTFEDIANEIGGSKEWVAAVMHGQQSMERKDSLQLARLLSVDPRVAYILEEPPMRGSLDKTVPVDPLIYRFYEITQVYGTTLKALINEMFGDGIMSAINLDIKVDKRPDDEDPEAERVVITLDGKFLPYEKW